jgi:hypothetical protein
MAELNVKTVQAEVERTKEHLKELIRSAFWGENDEEVRLGWTEFLQLSMPAELKKEPYFLGDIRLDKPMNRGVYSLLKENGHGRVNYFSSTLPK